MSYLDDLSKLTDKEIRKRLKQNSLDMDKRKERHGQDDVWTELFTDSYLPLSKELTRRLNDGKKN